MASLPRLAEAVPSGGAVLDAGTGPELFLVELAHRRADLRITGVDLSADMVSLAERNVVQQATAPRWSSADPTSPTCPFGDASFDLVVSTLSMHRRGTSGVRAGPGAASGRPLWIYDVRTVPDSVLAAAVGEAFAEQPLQRTLPRVSRFPWRPYARWAVSRPAETHVGTSSHTTTSAG